MSNFVTKLIRSGLFGTSLPPSSQPTEARCRSSWNVLDAAELDLDAKSDMNPVRLSPPAIRSLRVGSLTVICVCACW